METKSMTKFGTAPVFLTAISTILGAIMFLRFGYAVGHVGFFGVLIIIFLGHAVTIPTAMSLAEIATNQKVEGGGEYYIISRSFGLTIGGAIGVSLFLSQAISAAFYMIAFAEAFDPVLEFLQGRFNYEWMSLDKRFISAPGMILLTWLMITKGADLGIKVLYAVVGVLFVSLTFFFLGSGAPQTESTFQVLSATIENPDPFFYVFAICFPAFTGMTAGVGLSGDLKDPKRSIPLGTLAATCAGMVIYVFIAYKLAISASPQDLDNNQLIMGKIALWGPIIPFGLAAATLSSALGSIMVAPRTLQALGSDGLFPTATINSFVAREGKGSREPLNATWVACSIALIFVLMGDVNMVAEIISMFFMLTYGSICLISFLEHFSADPSYRPTFTSRWYISLFGALACGWLMFNMNATYAIGAILIMTCLYLMISYFNSDKKGLSAIVQGVIFQVSRQLQVFLQSSYRNRGQLNWRPSVVCISRNTFKRLSAFDMLRWISHHYGFGTYIHFMEGYLSKETKVEGKKVLSRLLHLAEASRGRVFVDTMVSPSMTTAICQVIQLPGISGHENNGILFEYAKSDMKGIKDIISNIPLILANEFDIYILASSERKFGYHKEIHIWLTSADLENASLMILTGYILVGDPAWARGTVKIYATYPEHALSAEEEKLRRLIKAGRLPISQINIQMIPQSQGKDTRELVCEHSIDADLVIMGLPYRMLKHHGQRCFENLDGIGDVLFITTQKVIEIASNAEINEVHSREDVKVVYSGKEVQEESENNDDPPTTPDPKEPAR